ncbi:iron ABC transporter permease [Chelativorans sp. AA-79]|uniref:FecCD family ABC transporter permease n=1 Tax=Chelativorans sp. AA-79 TaxID=3028735 RepID=UPI0023F74697|nr:iron ABC transporter permease [Chelativorans sp. AA-79]WEX08851.1 iron ABC transporter permease [Chelativorans sp. AA-79]
MPIALPAAEGGNRLPFIYAGLAALLCLAVLGSLLLGYTLYTPGDLWNALAGSGASEADTVIREYRLPRAVVAPLVGAALGVAGVIVQTLSRNRIASPDTLGLNAGASLAVVAASAGFGVSSLVGLSFAATAGAFLTSVVVFALAATAGGLSPVRIVLVGVTFAGLMNAMVEVVLTVNEAELQQLLFWLAGAFVDRPLDLVARNLPLLLAGGLLAALLARPLDALQTDDMTAQSLGAPVRVIRVASFVAVALLTGASVAMAGPVSFVGLVVPHAARALVGSRHTVQLGAAALIGAVYATAADILARFVIYPTEAPVGAITGVVGAGLLLMLLRRRAA